MHQPMGPATAAAALDGDALLAYDGTRLPQRQWSATGNPRAVVIALHGMNDYANAFAQPATWWSTQGVTTYAFDQRGFGAGARPGIWPDTATLQTDLAAAIAAIRQRHPGVPVFVLGESMGGAVAIAAAASAAGVQHALPVDGLILSAPALWGRQAMNPFFRLTLWLGYHTVPGMRLEPPRGLRIVPSDNLDMLRALSRDPLVIKRTRLDALKGLVDVMSEAYDGLDHLPADLPVLMLYGQHEQVLARDSVTETVARVSHGPLAGQVRLAIYDSGYHMLLRDRCAEAVWRDVLAWMADPAMPLPSGADQQRWLPSPPPERALDTACSAANPGHSPATLAP